MKFLVLLFLQLAIVHVAWSAEAILLDSRNADYPGKCYIKGDPPTILSPGDIVTIKGQCTRAICGGGFSVTFQTCGIVMGPKEYYIPRNNSRPYPDCCPHYDFS